MFFLGLSPAAGETGSDFPVLKISGGSNTVALNGFLFAGAAIRKDISWSEITRLPRSAWTALPTPNFNRGYSGKTYLLRIALKNTSATPIWYLGMPNSRLDYADFRLETGNGVREHNSGDHRAWTGSEPAVYPVFRFQLAPGERGVLYVRLRSTSLIAVHVYLRSAESFGAVRRQEGLIEIALGSIFLLLIGAQLFLHRRRDMEMQIYFALAMLTGALWMWIRFGDGPLRLYPGSVFWKDNGLFIALVPAMVFMNLFFRKFLDMRVISPRMDRLLIYSALAPLLTLPAYFLDIGPEIKNAISMGCIPVQSGAVLAAFIVSLRAKRWWILHVFIAWAAFQLAVLVLYLMLFRFLPYSPAGAWVMVFMVPMWLVVALAAMVWRVWALKRERDETLARMVDLLRRESQQTRPDAKDQAATPAGKASSERRVMTLDTESLMEGLMRMVKEEQLYLQEELSLEDFADRLGIRPDQLSALLNLKLGISFSRLINQHRIEEARLRLKDNPERTVLRIALDCGFGSRTAFHREFKRYTGMSPAAYREQINGAEESTPA